MAAIGNDLAMIGAACGLVCAGLVFVTAGAQKLLHRSVLRGVIANYRLLPQALVAPAAWLLPPAELLLGVLLLLGAGRPVAPLAAMLLLGVFAAAMAVNIRRGRGHIDCGCGRSFLRQPLRWVLVARNAVLALALLPSLPVAGPIPAPALLAGACAGAAFFMLYMIVNVLAALPASGEPGPMGA